MSSSAGAPRQRRPASRNVPQMSYAYGAPSTGTAARESVGPSAASLDNSLPRAQSVQLSPSPQPPNVTARERYERLKAKQRAAEDAAVAAAAAANANATTSTKLERNDPHAAAIAAPAASTASQHTSSNHSTSRATATRPRRQKDVSSFFVQQPSLSPTPDALEDAAAEAAARAMTLPSTLLRGAQRPSHDPMASPHPPSLSLISSDGTDSRSFYDYAGEEAFVRRMAEQTDVAAAAEAGGGGGANTPRATNGHGPRAWLNRISPWGPSREADGEQKGGGAKRVVRKKGRRSRDDEAYRPEPGADEDEDGASDDSEQGRKVGHGSRRRSSGAMARGGRDDAKIWMQGRKRRAGRTSKGRGGAGGAEAGDSDEDEASADDDTGAQDDTLDAREGHAPNGLRASSKAAARRNSDTADVTGGGGGGGVPSTRLTLTQYLLAALAIAGAAALLASQRLSSLPPSVSRWTAPGHGAPFVAPNVAPSNFDALVSRLTGLETALASLSSRAESARLSGAEELRSGRHLRKRVEVLEAESRQAAKLIREVEDRVGGYKLASEERIRTIEAEGRRMRDDVATLRAQLQQTEERAAGAAGAAADAAAAATASSSKEATWLAKRIMTLEKRLEKTDRELAAVAERALQAQQLAEAAKTRLDAVERHLPEQMAVRIDAKTGEPRIDPRFFAELRKVFAEKGEQAGKAGGSGSGSAQEPSSASWSAFTGANREALEALIRQYTNKRLAIDMEEGLIVSRSHFMELLHRELDEAKAQLEARFNENARELQKETLDKVRKQQEMYERSGSWSRGGGSTSSGSSAALTDAAQLTLKDGTDATAAVLTLVDAALERYSADRIARPDFALYTAGGRVVPSLTSPTYELPAAGMGGSSSSSSNSWLGRLARLGGSKSGGPDARRRRASGSSAAAARGAVRGRSPVVAIHHDVAPGMCWPFAGSDGQLGIALARRVVVTDVTLEHLPASLSLGASSSSSAPREVSVWGLVERAEDVEKLRRHRADKERQRLRRHLARTRRTAVEAAASDADAAVVEGAGDVGGQDELEGDVEGDDEAGEPEPAPAPPSPHHLHLASFTYDAARSAVQTFPASLEAKSLSIPVGVVQVRVHSNHGNEEYTCVYRVRVHGDEF